MRNSLISKSQLNACIKLIENSKTIAICAHENPDGDAIGSQLALGTYLKDAGYKIDFLLAKSASPPRLYKFLPNFKSLKAATSYKANPDLFISVDAPNLKRLGNAASVFERAKKCMVIDHHPDTDLESDLTLSMPEAASCSMLVFCLLSEMSKKWSINISQGVAEATYVGLITDTGKFQFQNTDAMALRSASDMVAYGVNPSSIATRVYETKSLGLLTLEARIIERINLLAKGKIAYSWLTKNDLKELHVREDETEGLVGIVRQVHGADIVLMFREHGDHIRCNIRAKGDLDVGVIARQFDGGGHKAAAGFTIKADMQEAIKQTISKLS